MYSAYTGSVQGSLSPVSVVLNIILMISGEDLLILNNFTHGFVESL
jgi:hypothetical protein